MPAARRSAAPDILGAWLKERAREERRMACTMNASRDVQLCEGPFDGGVIEIWEPVPGQLSMGVPESWGGPGVAYYDLDEEDGEACYRFCGWDYDRVSDRY